MLVLPPLPRPPAPPKSPWSCSPLASCSLVQLPSSGPWMSGSPFSWISTCSFLVHALGGSVSLSEVDTFLFKIQLRKLDTMGLKGACSPTGAGLPKEVGSFHTSTHF